MDNVSSEKETLSVPTVQPDSIRSRNEVTSFPTSSNTLILRSIRRSKMVARSSHLRRHFLLLRNERSVKTDYMDRIRRESIQSIEERVQ